MSRLTAGMAAHPRRVLAVVLAVTALFAVAARDVRLDNNFAALFATDSENAQFRQQHRDRWGPDDGLLVAVLHTDDAAVTDALADLVDRLTTEAAGIPAIDRVDSVASVDVVGPGPGGTPTAGPAFGRASPFDLEPAERLALAQRSRLGSSNLVSEDGRTFLVVGVLGPEYDSYESVVGPAGEFRDLVESQVQASGVDATVRFSGVAYTRIAAIDLMQSDLFRLSPLATLAMAVFLFVVFRRVAAVIGPLLAIGSSILITAGVIGLAGDDVNQVTVIYPILLMGVVVSGSTHLIHRYYREQALGRTNAEAGLRVMDRLRRPAFVAAFTTAAGFASLVISRMQILHEFGLYLAFGVMAALVLQLSIVPAVLTIAGSPAPPAYLSDDAKPAINPRDERFVRFLLRPGAAVSVLALGVVVSIASVLFASTATFDYALSDMLDPAHPVAEGNALIDSQLSGVVPIEIALQGPAGAFRDPQVLRGVHELSSWLEATHGVRTVSLAGVVEEIAVATGRPAGQFPEDPALVRTALDIAGEFREGRSLQMVVREDWSQARMFGYSPDHGGAGIVAMRDAVEQRAAELLTDAGVQVKVTGEAPVAYEGMNELTRELVFSTGLALLIIVAAILLVFRHGWLTLISILPNVAPILVGLGLYRITSDVLDPLPGVVLCVAIGLAADDTVHLINRWREVRRDDPEISASTALVWALTTVRRAMVTSSVALIAGFGALTLSTFGWNRQLGGLGAVVLLLALGSDLLFGVAGLALLARRMDRRRPAPTDSPHEDAGEAAAADPAQPAALPV